MNTGGDPERDEYGLPRVDIEIPDDARELDRDVQAYYRERRAQRRQRVLRRLGGPLMQDGMVLPLLASCLALTLLAGTLLTMFTARRLGPPAAQATSAPPSASPGGQLPDATVQADNQTVQLRNLRPSALALVPAACRCAVVARQLAAQASAASVRLYFVTAGSTLAQVRALARQRGMPASHLIQDRRTVLQAVYRPAGLTVVLVYRDGSVRLERDLRPGVWLEQSLRALSSTTPQGLDLPARTILAAGQVRL
ncbi:MAG: hypothetical protein ACHP9Z_18895 [Streptosporangiales bacterium]